MKLEDLYGANKRDADDMIQALRCGLHGWNLRCNVCGKFGASWRKGR